MTGRQGGAPFCGVRPSSRGASARRIKTNSHVNSNTVMLIVMVKTTLIVILVIVEVIVIVYYIAP